MYRARLEVEPPNALEFIQTIPLTLFNANYVRSVAINIDGVAHYVSIFSSERISKELVKLDTISFDALSIRVQINLSNCGLFWNFSKTHIPSYSLSLNM